MSNKQFVVVIIFTFVVVVIWIIADILHTQPSVAVNPKLNSLLTPISPNFDQKVISQIREVTPVGEIETEITQNRTPTPPPVLPSPTPFSTAIPVVSPSPSAAITLPPPVDSSVSAAPEGNL